MRQTFFLFLTALFVGTSSFSPWAAELSELPSGNYSVDLSHASIVWKVSHFGFSMYPGRFTKFDAELVLNTDDFSASAVKVMIDPSSIQTAYPYPDEENFDQVLAADWFLVEQHPQLAFQSTQVSGVSNGEFIIQGELTMLGKTLPVTLQAKLNNATVKHPFKGKPLIGFSAVTSIDRTQWGMTKFAPGIGATVEIDIEGEFVYTGDLKN